MKYIIELVAKAEGLKPAITFIDGINDAERKLFEQVNKTNNAFGKFAPVLENMWKGWKNAGKAAAGAFGGDAIKGATKQAESFRAQLRASRDELTKLLQSGEATTAQIYDMARAGGELKDSMGDAQQAINVLSSDTFKLDAALQGIQVGAAGFQILQGAAALAGDENEDLQKTLVRLNAVMAITQGLQQIQNALQKQTALSLGLNIAAQKTYTLVVGTSTGALKAFRIALAATGFGLIILALVALVTNWDKFSKTVRESFPALDGVIKFFTNFRQIAAGTIKSVTAGFAQVGKVISDIFNGDFSKAYNDAKKIGGIMAENFNKGYDEKYEQIKRQAGLKQRKFQADLLEAQGKDIKQLRLSIFQDELKDLEKGSDEYNDKLVEIAKLRYEIEQDALEKSKKLAEERLKREKELLQQEIQLQEINLLELTNNARERLKIEENLIFLKGELQKKDAKSLVEKQLIETKVITDIEELRKKFRENELKQIALREQKTLDAEKKTLEAELERERKRRDAHKQAIADLDEFRDAEAAYDKKWEDERKEKIKTYAEMSVQVAQETADTIFSIANSNRNAAFNAEIQQLNDRKNRELSNKELTEAQKTRIELRYQREIAAVKTRQAQADKQAAIAQAIVNGALAITKILALQGGSLNPAAIANIVVTTAATAAQVAVIASQKIPKYAKGTEYVNGGGTETSDSIPAMLSKGERVVDAKTNKMLKGIPNSMLPLLVPDLMIPKQTIISQGMDYDKLAKSLSKELSKNPQLLVNFDKRGFETFVRNGNSEQQIKNNRNGF